MYLVALIAQPRGREVQLRVTGAALPFFSAAVMDLMGAGTLGLAHVRVCGCFSPHSEGPAFGFRPELRGLLSSSSIKKARKDLRNIQDTSF